MKAAKSYNLDIETIQKIDKLAAEKEVSASHFLNELLKNILSTPTTEHP